MAYPSVNGKLDRNLVCGRAKNMYVRLKIIIVSKSEKRKLRKVLLTTRIIRYKKVQGSCIISQFSKTSLDQFSKLNYFSIENNVLYQISPCRHLRRRCLDRCQRNLWSRYVSSVPYSYSLLLIQYSKATWDSLGTTPCPVQCPLTDFRVALPVDQFPNGENCCRTVHVSCMCINITLRVINKKLTYSTHKF